MSNKPSKTISQLICLPAFDGGLPRESELGRLLFRRYLQILSGPMESSVAHLQQLRRLMHAIPRVEGGRVRRRLRLRKRDRRILRSLANWREYEKRDSWSDDPTSHQGGTRASSQELAREGTERRKSRKLQIISLGNTSYDSTSHLRYWTYKSPGPTWVTTELEDWIDYEVGPGRPFRPLTGSKGNGRVPTTIGILPTVTVGYGPLSGEFPDIDQWYEGFEQPRIMKTAPRQYVDRPVSEESISPSTREINLARLDAEASMYAGTPKVRPNFLRALLELKDLDATARGLADLFKWGRTFLRRMTRRNVWSSLGKGWRPYVVTGRESIAAVSGAYLNAQFGILPTWDDVMTFLDSLRRGLKLTAEDQGRALQDEGAVITSHYHVVPHEARSRLGKTYRVSEWATSSKVYWKNRNAAKVDQTADIPVTVSKLTKAARNIKTLAVTHVTGCVFARMKPTDDLSEYMKANFGKVGYTWSYPGITTAWELLPWSWLVDWFADVRSSVRVAERLARSYWMRVAFQEPWYFEKSDVHRSYPLLSYQCCELRGPQRAFRPEHGQLTATIEARHRVTYTYKGDYASRASYSRGPLDQRPAVPPTRARVRVNVFRISIGMALLSQAATSGRSGKR